MGVRKLIAEIAAGVIISLTGIHKAQAGYKEERVELIAQLEEIKEKGLINQQRVLERQLEIIERKEKKVDMIASRLGDLIIKLENFEKEFESKGNEYIDFSMVDKWILRKRINELEEDIDFFQIEEEMVREAIGERSYRELKGKIFTFIDAFSMYLKENVPKKELFPKPRRVKEKEVV